MDERLLEVREFNDAGFRPLIHFKTWRVAILNYLDEIHPEQIEMFERHRETDEVFVLLRGKGLLFLGEGERFVERIFSQVMEPGKIYNVRQNTWHSIVLSRDGSVLLVENQNTGKKNTDYSPLLPQHHQLILEIARRDQPGEWEK
jgi:mannose-6-phosphate isomerase-like protein (cupin superfamily)